MNKELYIGGEAKLKLIEGINKLSDAVLSTMGPAGRTVIISDEYGRPYITKDGVSVANSIKFRDAVENIGAKLIKEVAQKTADQAGDGTTTSICLAQAFIALGEHLIEKGQSSVEIVRQIDILVKEVLEHLQKGSRELRREDIHKVATISANGDEGIGNIIQKAYDHSDIVRVEEGKQKEDEIEVITGMIHPITYFSQRFVNNEKKKEVNYEEARVLVLDKKLEDLTPYKTIFEFCASSNTPLIIVTEHISDAVIRLLETNYINGYVKVAAVKAPGFGQYRKDNLQDIADFTGATLITNDVKVRPAVQALGYAINVSIGKYSTIIGKHKDVSVEDKIMALKEQSKLPDLNDYDRTFVFDRINNLNGSLTVIRVGGTSEVEMKERKDRVDDAVLAVKSALEEGIVEGGGIALVRALQSMEDPNGEIETTLRHALMSPARTIKRNSGDEINTEYDKNRFDDDIIDPLKVTRCALENAASVAKTILSTDAVVLNEQLWT